VPVPKAEVVDLAQAHGVVNLKVVGTQTQLVAQQTADAFVGEQMSTLAHALRAQAAVLKRKRKKKK
jgi:hypothetical protein